MGSPFQRAFSGKSPLNKHGKLQRKLDKVNKGKSKYILRELLKDYVPSQYFERPKQGFSIP